MTTSKSTGTRLLDISEIFDSVQGEGIYSGVPTTFIRLQGCPYRCTWCDSQYTWSFGTGDKLSFEQIIDKAKAIGNKWICVTGGEPLAQVGVWELFTRLRIEGFFVECETSGAINIKPDTGVHWVVDMKCPDSGMSDKNLTRNIDLLSKGDQLKFVLASEKDLDWSIGLLTMTRDARDTDVEILFSPVHGELNPDRLVFLLKRRKKDLERARVRNYRVSLQLHKYVWPLVERGV